MIRVVETDEQKSALLRLCEKSALGCKIYSISSCYGFDRKFATFWLDDVRSAVFSLMDGTMIIAGTISNGDEARDFIRMLSPSEIITTIRNSDVLELNVTVTGDIMRKSADESSAPSSEIAPDETVDIRELYAFFEACGMSLGEFEAFYLDLSHKLRHKESFVFTKRSEKIASAAIVSAMTPRASVVSCIATDEAHRREGLAAGLMKRIEAFLGTRSLYIFKAAGENTEFYASLDFKKTDTWVTMRV